MNWRNQGYEDDGRNQRPYGQSRGGGQRGGYRGNNQSGGGQRGYSGPRGNGGGQRGDYKPNTGKIRNNDRARQGHNDPQMTGVCNIEMPDGSREAFYISGWWNDDGSMGLALKNVNDASQGGQRGGGQRQGGYNGNRGGNGGGYAQQGQPQYEPRENGAMSRARPIPQPQYRDEPPPHDQYPEERAQPNFDDEIPF